LKKRLKQFGAFFLVASSLLLGGCTGGGALTQSLQMMARQMRTGADDHGLPQHPDPRFRYLRVEMPGRTPGIWVLAYVDPHPMGEIEVWHSAQGQELKLQNGRVVATHGLAVDWPAVRFAEAPPDWAALAADRGGAVAAFERDHDELPRYRYGVRERLVLQALAQAPPLQGPGSLTAGLAKRYAWFQETATPHEGIFGGVLTNWYAWGLHLGRRTVVFSEQCLTPDFCLRMQRWPVQEDAS
jgi:hypothetical protein